MSLRNHGEVINVTTYRNFMLNYFDHRWLRPTVVIPEKGIFVSRISLPCLTPVLSVGDELVYVEDEAVRGQNLEYVQSLIAGKTSVRIVLLPNTGSALC